MNAEQSKAARIAVWNLERPSQGMSPRLEAQHKKLNDLDADLWILTETNAWVRPQGYELALTACAPPYHKPGEACASVLSRWPVLRTVPTFDETFAVCVEISSPFGPMIVYGSLIPYADYKGPNGDSARWVEHRKFIAAHAGDWRRIRAAFPDHEFVAGGDYNQCLDGSGWYGNQKSEAALRTAMAEAGLTCATAENLRAAGKLTTRATIDHICLSSKLAARSHVVGAWEGAASDGARLSDHNGVYVDLKA